MAVLSKRHRFRHQHLLDDLSAHQHRSHLLSETNTDTGNGTYEGVAVNGARDVSLSESFNATGTCFDTCQKKVSAPAYF